MFPIHCAMVLSVYLSSSASMLNVTLQLARAGWLFGINKSTLQQLHLLKLWYLCQIKHDVSMNCWPFWSHLVGFLTYFWYCNGRNLQMLLDVNTVLGSCEYGKCLWCTFYSSIYCLFLYEPFSSFELQCSFATNLLFRIRFKEQIAT